MSTRAKIQSATFVSGLVLAAVIAFAAPARASAVLDFQTGLGGVGGTETLFTDGNMSGSGIPIGALTVTGAPSGNIVYLVTGPAAGSGIGSPFGSLSFATGGLSGSDFISIVGCVTGLTITGCPGVNQTLLSGTISSFTAGVNGISSAVGPDSKNSSLLAAIGLPASTPFSLFGFSTVTGTLTPCTSNCSGGSVISTDIKNTAVPEPASMVLLGTGLVTLAHRVRRQRVKKAQQS